MFVSALNAYKYEYYVKYYVIYKAKIIIKERNKLSEKKNQNFLFFFRKDLKKRFFFII